MANYTINPTLKKYPVVLLAKITGLSESTFTAAASAKKWSSKDGLNLDQTCEILRMPRRRGKSTQWSLEQGREVIEGLKSRGITVNDSKVLNEFYGSEKEGYLL